MRKYLGERISFGKPFSGNLKRMVANRGWKVGRLQVQIAHGFIIMNIKAKIMPNVGWFP